MSYPIGTTPDPFKVIERQKSRIDLLTQELMLATEKPYRGFWRGVAVGAALVTLLSWAMPAFAQAQCDSRDRVLALLADSYGENRRALGIAGEGSLMELFASDATGTLTITVTLPDGQMRLMASGVNFDGTVSPAGDAT